MADDTLTESAGRHRPKTTTVFVAAFVAGAVAAVVVNRALDLHLAQSKPQVESEPIFVALRPMPQGSPVTVWDVALRDWPRAMLPASALRAGDSFEGSVLKYPLREGQPLLTVQLMPATNPSDTPASAVEEVFVTPPPAAAPSALAQPDNDDDLRAPSSTAATLPEAKRTEPTETVVAMPTNEETRERDTVAVDSAATDDSAIVPIEVAALDDAAPATEPSLPSSRKRFELEPTEAADTDAAVGEEPSVEASTPEVTDQQPTRVASDVEPLLDMPSRPAVDLETIPSVMARSDTPAEPAELTTPSSPVRYLVVPERIARQADTSFVPPPAVEPVPEPSPAPAQPVVTRPPRTPQANAPAVKGFPQRTGSHATAARPMPQQQQRPQPAQPQQQKKQPQAQSPSPKQPQRQPSQQQTNQSTDRSRSEPAAKPREPMFPVLAAGIEAMGNRWRGGDDDEATPTDQPTVQRRK